MSGRPQGPPGKLARVRKDIPEERANSSLFVVFVAVVASQSSMASSMLLPVLRYLDAEGWT